MSARLMIAGTSSGSGKTTVTCGLLEAMKRREKQVSACKCGPDYIDPMFHRDVIGAPSRNLDLFLCGENTVRMLLADSCRDADLTVVEGVMGFYDGLGGTIEASSCHLAACTETPALLVADARGKSLSLAAELSGFARFRPNTIKGVILNRCSLRGWDTLKRLVEEHTGLPVLGYLPPIPKAEIGSRHLGLVTASEMEDLREKIGLLADQMEQSLDLDTVLDLAGTAGELSFTPPDIQPVAQGVRIAVARDEAFCFLYEDNLLLLELLGAELIFFSPLREGLPDNVQGLILPGGYPELYAERISANRDLLREIRGAVQAGLPVIAECGGFMLLCKEVEIDGIRRPMAGVIDTAARMTGRLSRFGYITLTARQENLLCGAGQSLRAHEFHYSEADNPGKAFSAAKQNGDSWLCVHSGETIWAGYPHLHLWGCPEAAARFVQMCGKGKGGRQ